MIRIVYAISFCLILLLVSSGILKAESSKDFTAVCSANLDDTFLQLLVTVENDSMIIKETFEYQCCAVFALNVSDKINDTINVTFKDTASAQCNCVCDFDIRINLGIAPKSPETITIKFNGKCYQTVGYDYHPLVEFNKTWNTIRTIPGLDYTYPTYVNYKIESDKGRNFCWKDKKYYEVKAEVLESNGAVYDSDTLIRYIREENGVVYQLDTSGLAYDGCEEYLIYDFTLEEGDTVVVGRDSIPFKVIPIEMTEIQGRRCWGLIDLSQPELSINTMWVEGVGDLRGVFKSGQSLGVAGTNNTLTCCSVDGEYIYQESSYTNCGYRPPYQFFIEEGKVWTSVTDCSMFEPYSHYTNRVLINSEKMDGGPFSMRYYINGMNQDIYYQEQGGRVYYHDNDITFLIYDFTLKEGDSVHVGDPNYMIFDLKVDSVKYLTYSDSQLRKTIYLNGNIPAIWVEGIGDLSNPLYYWMPIPLDGCHADFACCSLNDELLYQNVKYPNCGGFSSIEKDIWQGVNIHPNPSSRLFTISGIEFIPGYDYTVLSSQGIIVQSGTLKPEIELNEPNGIYLLIIRQKGVLHKTYKLVIDK